VPLQISPELVLVTLLTLVVPLALAWGIYRLVRRAVRDAMREHNSAP
jgi:ABC-type bacteriocin/lantibiotic exporter with double-glycine peptidase domain